MDKSKLRWLRPIIVLTAAAIVCIADIVNGGYKVHALKSLLVLLGVILLFMFIGTLVTTIIERTINVPKKKDSDPDDLEDEEEEKDEGEEDYEDE